MKKKWKVETCKYFFSRLFFSQSSFLPLNRRFVMSHTHTVVLAHHHPSLAYTFMVMIRVWFICRTKVHASSVTSPIIGMGMKFFQSKSTHATHRLVFTHLFRRSHLLTVADDDLNKKKTSTSLVAFFFFTQFPIHTQLQEIIFFLLFLLDFTFFLPRFSIKIEFQRIISHTNARERETSAILTQTSHTLTFFFTDFSFSSLFFFARWINEISELFGRVQIES